MLYIAVLLLPTVVLCDISCSTGKTYVTCNFNRDIKEEKLDFIIWKYPFGTTESSGIQALSCNWVDRENPLYCRLKSGYTFDYKVRGGLLSVDMANVSRMYEGIYMCQLVNGGSIPFTTCNITVNDAESDDKSTSPSAGTSQSLGTTYTECEYTGLIFMSVLFFFVLVALLVLVRLNYRIQIRRTGISAEKNGRGCCGLIVPKVTRRHGDLNATQMELAPLNTVNTESEVDLGDGKNSTAQLPSTGRAANTAVSSTNKQESVTDVDTSINHPLAIFSDLFDYIESSGRLNLWMDSPLKEDESDQWTSDQVCRWLTQEGLGIHVKYFEHKVDGKRLLSFSYEKSLWWYLGMGDGLTAKTEND